MRVSIVILAAGASVRLGQPKQLLRLQGETLVHRAARIAREVTASIIVVLGASADQIAPELTRTDTAVAVCDRWQDGMGASLACGIAALPPDCDAALVMVCDQPGVTALHLEQMVEVGEVTGALIVAASYRQTLGVPCLFQRALFDDLQQIPGDKGARVLIQKYRSETVAFDLPEAALDVDTLQDYKAVQTALPDVQQ